MTEAELDMELAEMEWAVGILNKHRHRGSARWQIFGDESDEARDGDECWMLERFEVLAVAYAYTQETYPYKKDVANG